MTDKLEVIWKEVGIAWKDWGKHENPVSLADVLIDFQPNTFWIHVQCCCQLICLVEGSCEYSM